MPTEIYIIYTYFIYKEDNLILKSFGNSLEEELKKILNILNPSLGQEDLKNFVQKFENLKNNFNGPKLIYFL